MIRRCECVTEYPAARRPDPLCVTCRGYGFVRVAANVISLLGYMKKAAA